MKKQVLVIHGGSSFNNYENYLNNLKNSEVDLDRLIPHPEWKSKLQKNLGDDYIVYLPKMPQKDNASYLEWKIYFEKILEKIDGELILVGHSLGAIFLIKYLSENIIRQKINGLFLVAAPYENDELDNEVITDFITKNKDLQKISEQTNVICLYHSKDDPIVPYSHSGKYIEKLREAKLTSFDDRSHIFGDNLPEIIEDIKSLS
jgi:hypothetical protein